MTQEQIPKEVKDKIEDWLKPYFPEVPIENCTGPVDYEQRNTLQKHKRNCLRKGAEFGYTLKQQDLKKTIEEQDKHIKQLEERVKKLEQERDEAITNMNTLGGMVSEAWGAVVQIKKRYNIK